MLHRQLDSFINLSSKSALASDQSCFDYFYEKRRSFFTSLTIETSQLILSYFYLEHRLFDINDLLQNTLGGLAVFGLFLSAKKLLKL